MAYIRLPEKQKPVEVLREIEPLVNELRNLVTSQEQTLADVRAMSTGIRADEQQLSEDRKALYGTLLDKVRCEEIASAEEFCSSVKAEVEKIEAGQKKPEPIPKESAG